MGIDRKKKLIMWAVFILSFAQTPNAAISPAINQIKSVAFPGYELSFIQLVMVLSSLVSPVFFITSAELIRRGVIARRTAICFGMSVFGLVGILSFFLHEQLWHVVLMSVLCGVGIGSCIANATSVMSDYFDLGERQRVMGVQTMFINAGGAFYGFVGGFLASIVWHGAYKVLLLSIPVAIFAFFAVPGDKLPRLKKTNPAGKTKLKLDKKIYLYAVASFFFIFVFNAFGGNISTHLAQSGFEDPKFAGIASAIQMGGGGVFGLIFSRLSRKFGDLLVPMGFAGICLGFAVMSIFSFSLYLIYLGAFIVGCAFSTVAPQSVLGTSKCVDPSTSAIAAAIVSGVVPSLGGFLSPLVITNVTQVLGGASTSFRFIAVGLFSLMIAFVLLIWVNRSGVMDRAQKI